MSAPASRRRIALVAGGVLAALVLVALAELGLRLAGFGGRAPLLRPLELPPELAVAPAGSKLFEIDPRLAEIYFARAGPGGATFVGGHRREIVVLPKPAGALRVVLCGASTIEGFPMPRQLTAARFLEAMLAELLPGRSVQVVNLGVTAVASFPIREIAVEAIEQLEPDVVLLYEAHNEFFGAFGVASLQSMGRSPGWMKAGVAVRELALYQAFEALGARDESASSGASAESATRPNLIEVMAAVPEVAPGDPLRARATSNLIENFRAVVRAGRAHGVPVVLSTVVSIERGLVPVRSFAGDLAAERRPGFERELEADRVALDASPSEASSRLPELERLAAAAPRHAAARYLLARALEAAGRGAEATEAYRAARDLDAMPWRAPRAANDALRALATEEGAPLADPQATFAAESIEPAAPGATGWELFADHVHPRLEGQALLARAFLEALVAAKLVPVEASRLASLPEPRAIAERLGVDPLELYASTHAMATLFRGPPFAERNAVVAERIDRQLAAFRERASPLERAALERWELASASAGFALPISWFGAVAALDAGDDRSAALYARVAAESALPLSDERVAAGLLEAIAVLRGGADPAVVRARLVALERDAARVAALAEEPSALLEKVGAALATLTGESEAARAHGETAAVLGSRAAAWQRAFVGGVPEPAALVPLAERLRPQ